MGVRLRRDLSASVLPAMLSSRQYVHAPSFGRFLFSDHVGSIVSDMRLSAVPESRFGSRGR